jgi:hypothetical protein
MWLDRFSAQSSPSASPPPQRSAYSPAPRRGHYSTSNPSLPPRPGINPRSSSLSLISSTSDLNLPISGRLPNGSALSNEIRSRSPNGLQDPRAVLETIVGGPSKKRRADGSTVAQKPEDIVDDIDFGSLSLEAFEAKSREKRTASSNKPDLNEPADEYHKEKDKFEDLHHSIAACDQVLKSVETYLTGFQADLGAVSAEIETLQTRSASMNSRLENRRVVEKLLGPAVEDISLSPAVVSRIVDGQIDESWVKALAELEKRCKVVDKRFKEEKNTKAIDDLKPLLDDLTGKAVERIRDYLVAQIKALRSPSINAQVIQQNNFLRFKDLYTFLARHRSQLADDVGQAYVNTMRWYYLHHFTRYDEALRKMKLHQIDKSDVLGSFDDSNGRRGRAAPARDAFSLGRRSEVLRSSANAAIPSHVAEEDQSMHFVEIPFRAFNIALVDNASFEYSFLSNFFSPSQSHHAIARTFDSTFAPSFAIGQALTKTLVENSSDALGILICVRLNQHFAFELQRRKVPAVEGYINGTNMLLWPRFQMVMDMHCESLRKAASTLSGRPNPSNILGAGGSANSTAPHPLTQRFASFLQGILVLSSEAGDDEPVANSLARLRTDFEAFLSKMSKGIGDNRKRERFLYNNYSLIGTILEDAHGKLAVENKRHFDNLKDTYGREDQ